MDRYVVIHVATTCDEHGVYVTKDSAEVIEIGWILLNAKTLEEVGFSDFSLWIDADGSTLGSSTGKAFLCDPLTLRLLLFAVCLPLP
jgi:hypothetical protein